MRYCYIVMLSFMILFFGCYPHSTPMNEGISTESIRSEEKEMITRTALTDEFEWLKDESRQNPDVLAFLEAENQATQSVLEPIDSLRKKIYEEILQSMNRTFETSYHKRGDYYSYARIEQGKPYQIVCRKKGSLTADEEIVLDINELAQGHGFVRVSTAKYSPDMNYYAYLLETKGNERGELWIKDLTTGTTSEKSIKDVKQFDWANDNKTIIYTSMGNKQLPDMVKRHTLGNDPETDAVVYHEKDPGRFITIKKFSSQRFIGFDSGQRHLDEWYVIDADHPSKKPQLIQAAEPGLEYLVIGDRNDMFYILVLGEESQDGRIVAAPVDQPDKSNWIEFYPEKKGTRIEKMLIFQDYGVIVPRHAGVVKPVIIHWDTNTQTHMTFPEEAYSFYTDSKLNIDFDSQSMRYYYTSLVSPGKELNVNMETGETTEIRCDPSPPDYNPDDYKSERLYVTSTDGTQVPVSLLYKKEMFKQDGTNPLLLETYGGYGVSMDLFFNPFRLPLLNRGVVIALAHIRGGGEYGHEWQEQGEGMNKKNGIMDFIESCKTLIELKYTDSDGLIITGGSAGGLIIGAAANMHPELFKVVIAHVPFVDLLNTVIDNQSTNEYQKTFLYGDIKDPDQFNYIKSYCPYQNVRQQAYPHIYIRNGFQDARVQFWQPAKWAAKLHKYNTAQTDILLDTDLQAGHFGPSNRFNMFDQMAKEWAFALSRVGITR